MRRFLLLIAVVIPPLFSSPALAGEGTVFTLWPLADYRSSSAVDYTSFKVLGPLLNYERDQRTTRFALRPLFYHQHSRDGQQVEADYLFPVASRQRSGEQQDFQVLRLLNYDFGASETATKDEFNLFPLLFYGQTRTDESYFAFFPVGGRIRDKFGRETIDFALFPLYSRTVADGLTTHNLLWPFFALSRGPSISGWQFWPIYGSVQKQGSYEKRFLAWPLYIASDVGLDTAEPVSERLFFPAYHSVESSTFHSRTWLWPFFNHVEDEINGYEEWDFPWPLLRRTVGANKHGVRIFPFYTDETAGVNRQRYFLWPLYKIEESRSEIFVQRRDRILYFLYSDLEERVRNEPLPRKKRVALWPLFTYESRDGVATFSTFALLEPFYPGNDRIARNLAPFWHVYQARWDQQGNSASSLFWNLYWKERRGSDYAWELFPLLAYSQSSQDGSDLRLLKGLLRFQHADDHRTVKFLFLPWGIGWGAPQSPGSR